MKSNRGEQGVGIALGEHGVAAWKEAGSVLHNDFGGRIIAIRLQFRDARGKLVCIFLVSAYCPIGSSDPEKWEEFLAQLDSCVARKVRGGVHHHRSTVVAFTEFTTPRQTSLSSITVPRSSVLMLVSLEITSGNDSFLPLARSELDFQRRREEITSFLAR